MSHSPKLGCGTGSWECSTPEHGTQCFVCRSQTIFGSCSLMHGQECAEYSGDMLSFPHGVNMNPPGTAPNCNTGWWPCYEADGRTMGCFACHNVDPSSGYCLDPHGELCSTYGKNPVQ